MASQKQNVKDALTELENLYKSRDSISTKWNKEILPFQQTFDAAVAPHQVVLDEAKTKIAAKYAKKYEPILATINALEKEIEAQMFAKVDGTGRPILDKVESTTLIAQTVFQEKRTVDPETFIETAKGKTGLWGCVQVLIGNAEKLLGKSELDKIAVKVKTWRISISKK